MGSIATNTPASPSSIKAALCHCELSCLLLMPTSSPTGTTRYSPTHDVRRGQGTSPVVKAFAMPNGERSEMLSRLR
jgi:hypothetical protein